MIQFILEYLAEAVLTKNLLQYDVEQQDLQT